MLNNFEIEFVTELFLDTDSVSNTNRLVVAVANAINQNTNNLVSYNNVLNSEYNGCLENEESLFNVPQRKRLKNFYENVILNYSDDEYKCRFKMRRSSVKALIAFLAENVNSSIVSIVPLHKKVHIFLWLLTSTAPYTEVGDIFGLHKSSVGYIFHEVASMLEEVKYNFMCWPSPEEQHITRMKVYSRYKFPNCVGFLDASRFKIGSKLSRKATTIKYILLQAVCDESLMFVDVFVGDIGKLKNNKVYKESPLASELENFVDFDNHILAPIEYKLHSNLVTPYTSDEILTSEEMKFNDVHHKTHSYITCAFQVLRENFKRLDLIDVKLDSVKTLLYAACVVHNFIMLHEGNDRVLKEEPVSCEDGVTIDNEIVKNALEKREFLCNYINFIDEEHISP